MEEQLYKEYEEFKEIKTYYTINGVKVKRFKTIEENNIKDGDKIVLMVYDD